MHILVVEDEMRLVTLLRRSLSEEGHAVDFVTTGEDAIVWLESENGFDAVILDAYWSSYLGPTKVRVPDGFTGGAGEFFQTQLVASIRRLSAKGITVFVVDHDMSKLEVRPATSRKCSARRCRRRP